MLLQVPVAQPTVQPEILFFIAGFPVTNAMLTGVLVTFVFLSVSLIIAATTKLMPSRFQTLVEMTVEGFVGLLEQITGKRSTAEKLLPLVGAIFLFMGLSNLILLIPGLSSFTYNGDALFRTPTNDFNTTFSIAFAVVIITQVASIQAFGVLGHIGKYVKVKDVVSGFKEGIGAGALAMVDFFIGLLDIISEIAKVISLSLRLFGNMYAGEVLAAILLGAFAVLVPAPWLAMNILIGVLQALVFGALTAAYYALAVQVMEETA